VSDRNKSICERLLSLALFSFAVDYIIDMVKEMSRRNAADPSLKPLPDPRRQTPPEGKTMKKIIEAAVEKAGDGNALVAGKGAVKGKTVAEYLEQRLERSKATIKV
jgi:hypothetical protein